MKRLIFDEDHEMFRDSVRRFMQSEVTPHVEQWREDGCCDPYSATYAGYPFVRCLSSNYLRKVATSFSRISTRIRADKHPLLADSCFTP